jgi:hypothetical protein
MMDSTHEYLAGVRKKYAARACDECQRRKRKCTAEAVCRTCRRAGTTCVYSQLQPRPSRPGRSPQSSEHSNSFLLARTQMLEQRYEDLRQDLARLANAGHGEPDRLSLQPLPPPAAEFASATSPLSPTSMLESKQEPTSNNVFERNTEFVSSSSFFRQIDLLDRSVIRDLGKGEEFLIPPEEGQPGDYESLSAGIRLELDEIIEQTRMEDLDKTLQSLDIYFSTLHLHYPCINEMHLRSQLAAFLASDGSMGRNVTIQYAALLNFMLAVGRILYDDCLQDSYVPGSKEFSRAEKLLNHATWLEKANIMTIQILLVKTCYCLYIARLNAAYDTVGIAVRLCFQLGLHNEPSWGEGCDCYDRTYRQRVFWSIYCLNHIVAQKSGVPDLIHESDFDVDLPKCVDDRVLYPNCPPLLEFHRASPIPYLLEVIKWAKLSSEIWDGLFGVGAEKPTSSELIAKLDDKILDLSENIPGFLRWPPASGIQTGVERPTIIAHQSFILYLRIRHLRMLIRREEMVSLRYQRRTAELCIEVAADIVNSVELQSSGSGKQTMRYAYMIHLTGAVVPMICIIVQKKNSEDLVEPAINLLTRALRIIDSLSDGFWFARRTLRQLHRPIHAACETINSQWPQYSHLAFAPTSFDSMGGAQGIMSTLATLTQQFSWNSEGNVMARNLGKVTTTDGLQIAIEDTLMWESSDLWNEMNNLSNWYPG